MNIRFLSCNLLYRSANPDTTATEPGRQRRTSFFPIPCSANPDPYAMEPGRQRAESGVRMTSATCEKRGNRPRPLCRLALKIKVTSDCFTSKEADKKIGQTHNGV